MKGNKIIIGQLLLLLLLAACKEETRVSTVEGFLFNDCSFPLAGTEVAFKANRGGAFAEEIILASNVCDANGYFRFTYELEEDKVGSANLIMVESEGFTTVLQQIPLNKDQQLRAFKNNATPVIFKLTGTKVFLPTDTFYYGIQNGPELSVIQPSIGFSDTLYTKFGNVLGQDRWIAFYFGFGKNNFQLSKEALSIQDSLFQNVYVNVSGCDDLEAFDLFLP